jgi:hypothetical protein
MQEVLEEALEAGEQHNPVEQEILLQQHQAKEAQVVHLET